MYWHVISFVCGLQTFMEPLLLRNASFRVTGIHAPELQVTFASLGELISFKTER